MSNDDPVPLLYVKGTTIFHRPVKTVTGTSMGFAVCDVHDGVNPDEVCALLNRAEKPED